MKKSSLLGAVCACVFSWPVNSSIIFDNGLPDPSIPITGYISDPGYPKAVIDNFSLGSSANVVENIRWWGTTTSGNIDTPDNFTISIYVDNGIGTPVKTSYEVLSLLGNITKTLINNQYFEYTATIAPKTFTPNQTFWLSIQNDSPHNPYWIWETSSSIGEAHTRDGNAFDWVRYYNPTYDTNLSLAFQLEGTVVPIAPSVWLFGSGLLGLVGVARKKAA